MAFYLPKFSIAQLTDARFLIVLFITVMCIQFVPLEGTTVSPIKVGLMALSPLLFVIKVPYVSRALFLGMLYWFICYFVASSHGYMRFSTIGYLGMFVITYIVFYHLVQTHLLTLNGFTQLLKNLIKAYGIVLILQQIAMLANVHYFPLINLDNQFFLSLIKLPSLSLEPSHSARLLSVMMLGYIRCLDLQENKRVMIGELFCREHRITTILFLWSMLTMGSGTAFIGLGLLSLYFIRPKNVIYIVPLIALFIYIGKSMELTQMDRAIRVVQATGSGDIKAVQEEDGSAASRIIPIMNTLKMDLTQKETWLGKGTASNEEAESHWKRYTNKITVVDQYGLIAFIVSLILFYSCMTKSLFSLETLFFLILFGTSLGNFAYTWGAMMIFTGVRYYQVQQNKILKECQEF